MIVSGHRDCVIAGGGPAGMFLGYLLAREGFAVTVLEKHADFLRDFRGDTIHPSTLTLLGELGLRERFLELPVDRVRTLDAVIDGERHTVVDFGTLPPPDDFLAWAPQWDLLDFLAREASALPGFELRMSAEATGLIHEDGRVAGVRTPDGEIRATLTVAADGRGSRIRDAAGLVPERLGAPIDVLWFSLPAPPDAPPPTLAYVDSRAVVLTIPRGDRYQSGAVIEKGAFERLRTQGVDRFRAAIVLTAPVLEPVIGEIRDWDQVKLLSVQLDRLRRWHVDGLVAIGDAAHAMSPVMGVGINYAIQDAVALAGRIAPGLRAGQVPAAALQAVQERRLPPVLKMQRIQQLVHERIAGPSARGRRHVLPAPARLALRVAGPLIRREAARLVGRGFRPEHVTPGGGSDRRSTPRSRRGTAPPPAATRCGATGRPGRRRGSPAA